jgi:hypothetical protein
LEAFDVGLFELGDLVGCIPELDAGGVLLGDDAYEHLARLELHDVGAIALADL